MLNLLATLVVSVLPASPGAFSACPGPTPADADVNVGADVGECGEAAPLDLWYRMSRFADGDPGAVGAGPARRTQLGGSKSLASCDAPQTPAQLPAPQAPPAALFALPALLDLQVPLRFEGDTRALPARALAPPERPPRA